MSFIETVTLFRRLDELPALENFVRTCPGLDADETNKSLIITTEIFENIVNHSKKAESRIKIRLRKNGDLKILFLFQSSNFEIFVRNIHNTGVYYDSGEKRYRGLGVSICYNLSKSMRYRVTSKYNLISITL